MAELELRPPPTLAKRIAALLVLIVMGVLGFFLMGRLGEAMGAQAELEQQREEAAEQYRVGGRPELAERELYEIEVIRRFMPRQLSPQEMEQVVDEVIAETGASGLKDMGRVMAALKQGWPGQIDGAVASALVKKKLG